MKTLKLTPELEANVLHNPKHRAAFRILSWFIARKKRGGTADECEVALDIKHQTTSPRINELARAGCIFLTDERRLTRSKKFAGVYRYKEGASFALFLGLPPAPPRKRELGLTPREQVMLAAAKSYVIGRAKAGSEAQIKRLIVKLVRALNDL